MTSADPVSPYRLRQLRSAAAQGEALDKAVLDELASIDEEHRLYVFRPETRCRVCTSDAASSVNTMLSHAMTYADILRTLEPINDLLPDDRKITYNSIWTHAKKHFQIEEAAKAVYRRIVEKRAEEYERDFVKGVGGALTPMAYLEVVMNRAFETVMDTDNTVIDVDTGLRAAEKLHNLVRDRATDDGDIAEMMGQIDSLVDAIKAVVPEDQWQAIIDHMDGKAPQAAIDAEVVEDYEEGVVGVDPDDPDLED